MFSFELKKKFDNFRYAHMRIAKEQSKQKKNDKKEFHFRILAALSSW